MDADTRTESGRPSFARCTQVAGKSQSADRQTAPAFRSRIRGKSQRATFPRLVSLFPGGFFSGLLLCLGSFCCHSLYFFCRLFSHSLHLLCRFLSDPLGLPCSLLQSFTGCNGSNSVTRNNCLFPCHVSLSLCLFLCLYLARHRGYRRS